MQYIFCVVKAIPQCLGVTAWLAEYKSEFANSLEQSKCHYMINIIIVNRQSQGWSLLFIGTIVLHHWVYNFLPLFFQIFPLVIAILVFLLVQRRQKEFSLFVLLNFRDSWVWVVVSPLDCQHFTTIQGLVGHGLLCKLSHTAMGVFNKGITFMRKDVNIL